MQHIKHSNLLKFIFFGIMLSMEMLGLFSCKKYLDKKQNTKVTTIDRVEDLQALLNTTEGINIYRCGLYGEGSSDDYFSLDPSIGTGENGVKAYSWQYFIQTISTNGSDWQSAYLPINIANICIEGTEKFPKTVDNASQWANVKGSALFIRAFYFFNLSCIYTKAYDSTTANEDMGIALKLNTDPYDPTTRASVSQSYEQIIIDAKASINYLPDIGLHPLRPSKAAAYGLLARIYLSMRQYDSALKYANLSLNIRSELMDYNNDGDIVNPINGVNSPFRQFNKETIFYADMNTGAPHYYLLKNSQTDTVLYSLYSDNDLRKTTFFRQDVNGYQKFKGNYTQADDRQFGGIATDEMFLTRAECYARKGMLQKSMDDLNALMIKRWKNNGTWVPFTAGDQEDALHKIWQERRKELVFRGLRWIDLKRFNKEGADIKLKRIINGQTYELLPNSDKYALPIPEDIVQLTGVPQNPGWQ